MGSSSGERAETAALLKDVDPWNGGRRTRKQRQTAEYKNKETIQNIHLPVSAKNVAYVLTDLEKEKNKKKRKKRQKQKECCTSIERLVTIAAKQTRKITHIPPTGVRVQHSCGLARKSADRIGGEHD